VVAQASEPASQGKEGTRRRLVEAALEVFAERGYHASSLSEIAARAGLTTGAVYSAFGSKKQLLLAVCSEAAQDPDTEARLTDAAGVHEALERNLRENAVAVDTPETDRLVRMQLEMLQLGTRDAEVFRLLSASVREALADAADLLESLAAREGSALPMPADELAVLWVAMQNGLSLLRLVDPGLTPENVVVRAASVLSGRDVQPPRLRGRQPRARRRKV
jgi:AcrR family transcriptional regulator